MTCTFNDKPPCRNCMTCYSLGLISQVKVDSQQAKLDAMIDDLVPDLKPIVQRIERRTRTTQNAYGDYMNLIVQLGKDDARMRKLIALALLKAGANKAGVRSALKVIGG